MYVEYNPNPAGRNTGDCVIRALSKVMNTSWDETFFSVMAEAFTLKDMPSANSVWGSFLKNNGFKRSVIPDYCPNCYTIKDFCDDHFKGTFVLATGTHVVAVVDGNYYDSWDSGKEVPAYYWRKNGSV